MALPSSGSLSISQVNTELNNSATATLNLGSSSVRTLYNVASGAIRLAADGYGKSNFANVAYSSPGTYSLLVPAGIYVDIRAARGGKATAQNTEPGYGGRLVVRTTSTQTFQIVVGAVGGQGAGGGRNAGGGGGYSGIFVSSVTHGNYVAVAGGGGGCGTGNESESIAGGSGAGYGTGDSGSSGAGAGGGGGGSTSAGGGGGGGSYGSGENGSALQGGRGRNENGGLGGSNGGSGGSPGGGGAGGQGNGDGGGGGGGGGYYGGGGSGAASWGAGGGGGSGNYNASYTELIRSSTGYNNGAGSIAFYTADPG